MSEVLGKILPKTLHASPFTANSASSQDARDIVHCLIYLKSCSYDVTMYDSQLTVKTFGLSIICYLKYSDLHYLLLM